jgi:hypothetical protein
VIRKAFVISRFAEKLLPLPGVPKIRPLGFLSRGTFLGPEKSKQKRRENAPVSLLWSVLNKTLTRRFSRPAGRINRAVSAPKTPYSTPASGTRSAEKTFSRLAAKNPQNGTRQGRASARSF